MARVEDRTTVLLCGDLKGGRPSPGDSETKEGISASLLDELRKSFSGDTFSEACNDCRKEEGWRACNVCWNQSGRPPLSAVFVAEEVPALKTEGKIQADEVLIREPWIERDKETGDEVILFRWWEATFSIDLPSEVVRAWGEENESGDLEITLEAYERWIEEKEAWGLQDGPRYWFGDLLYELDGFGQCGCSPEEESVNAALATIS